MAVKALREYKGVSKDVEANFNGGRIVYFGWDKHLMFYSPICLCLPPTTTFQEVVEDIFPQHFGRHPDFEKIDWNEVEWIRGKESFAPNMEQSLDNNGIRHKTIIRMRTPGLDGINGVGY